MNEQKQVSTGKVVKITVIVLITIIVFIVVLNMVGALMCAGAGTIVMQNVENRLNEARKEQTTVQIRQLESALKLYKVDNGYYPETQQGLQSLVSPPAVGRLPQRYSPEGYLEGGKVPPDQWGNEYIYFGPDQTQDGSFKIISSGPDGELNWGENNDDISSLDIQGGK